jgi:hypothetical protein
MKMSTVTKRNIAIVLTILMALSSIMVYRAVATNGALSLPPTNTPVTIEVRNGTVSYFDTTLSNVPAGYDVANAVYRGWCVDITAEMARSPATHEVTLYSSINPPGEFATERWDMINYVLNHKQGTAQDIQQAIWYFANMDGNFTPSSNTAWAIVNDTLANGNGFPPAYGPMIAVICFPVVLLPQPTSVQISIIEVPNTLVLAEHDVVVTEFALTKTVVGQGFSTGINVVAANIGLNTEDLNVTAYADATSIATQEMNLTNGKAATIEFGWNTTGVAYGNYTITAVTNTVTNGTNTVNSSAIVTIPGDVNGDFKVSLADLTLLANAYGTQAGHDPPGTGLHQWNPNADIGDKGIVGLTDLGLLAIYYGKHYP